MSLSGAINSAIKVAKAKLGDMVRDGTYRSFTGRSYIAGVYTPSYNNFPVSYAPDRFTLEEMQDADYQLSDVKIVVFNPDNQIGSFTVNDAFIMESVQYNIKRVNVAKIGNFQPVVTLVIRK
jgi:hypothetical protein